MPKQKSFPKSLLIKSYNIADFFFFNFNFSRSLLVFLLRSNFVSIYSPGDIKSLLDCSSVHSVRSSVVSVLVLLCESFVFLNT